MNLLGNYDSLLERQLTSMPILSPLGRKFEDIEKWKKQARAKVRELIASPPDVHPSHIKLISKYKYEGLEIEKIKR